MNLDVRFLFGNLEVTIPTNLSWDDGFFPSKNPCKQKTAPEVKRMETLRNSLKEKERLPSIHFQEPAVKLGGV